jgi:glycerol dehydrogenase
MIKSMRSPQYFVVGAGAISKVGEHAAHFGRRALVIGGNRALEAARPGLLASLDASGVSYHVEQGDHVRKTLQSVNALCDIGRQQKADLVIGCGGGAVMDCGKAVSHDLGVPYIAVPTTAGVNAAGTSGASIEGDTGPRRHWYQAVDVVIADTAIIAQAGARTLASGMGDALPSKFGAQLAQWRGARDVTASRIAFAHLCSDTILTYGTRAFRACEQGVPTDEVDRVVEAVLYQSGMGGFGLGGDHVLHPARMPGARPDIIHGEWVAFGTLVRLVLGGEFPADLPRIIAFDRSVRLPTTFAEFGLDNPSWEDVLEEARRIVGPKGEADYGTGRPVTPEEVCEAMFEVDYLGRTLT